MAKDQSISEEIYNTLKAKIISFEYQPGQLLMVQQVAEEYQISRTPAREAMVRLRDDGFLSETNSRKFCVAEIKMDYIRDLYALRIILESAAIRNSVGQVPKKKITSMRLCSQKMDNALAAKNYSEFFKLDEQFHLQILSLKSNLLVDSIYQNICDHQQQIRYITASIENRISVAVSEHNLITDAIESGEVEAAVNCLQGHLNKTVEDIEHLRTYSPMFASIIK